MSRLVLTGALLAAALAAGASGSVRGTPVAITSTVWSGYAAYGATFSDAKGSWVEPHVTCGSLNRNTKTLSAFWVGLDGYNSNTVEQAGTEADCNGSTPTHFAWYEFYPAKFTKLPDPVGESDLMSVEVQHVGSQVTITFRDQTAPWTETVSTTSIAKDQFSSAEWIAESLSEKLSNFGTVAFSNASASAGSVVDGPIDDTSWSTSVITMVSNAGQNAVNKDAISPLSGGGKSFSATWQHV